MVVGPLFDEKNIWDFCLFCISQLRETYCRIVQCRPATDELRTPPFPKENYKEFDDFLKILPDMLQHIYQSDIQKNLKETIEDLSEIQARWIERESQKRVPPLFDLGKDDLFPWTVLLNARKDDGTKLTEEDE